MKRRHFLLAAIAAVLVFSAGIGGTWAYFSTTMRAVGSVPIDIGTSTEIEEPDVINWVKHVIIRNEENSQPVFVRVQAFAGSQYTLTYSGEGWTDGGDGWWYWDEPLAADSSTGELLVAIGNVPADVQVGDNFNVAVVYESTPVQYEADGTAYADWSYILDDGTTEGGV